MSFSSKAGIWCLTSWLRMLSRTALQPSRFVVIPSAAAPVPGTGPTIQIQTEKIADGLWFLNFGAPQSLLVEFKDYVVIIEAPTGDERSMATIAESKRMFPNKPIKYVINTHHHADHSGGIRAYVAEGIPIITHESHKRYYEQDIFNNPHKLNPDRLARMPRAPVIETVK